MKKNCLIIFKWPIFLNKFVVNKLSKFYQTEFLYLSDFKDKSFSEIIEEINDFILDVLESYIEMHSSLKEDILEGEYE